MAVGYCSHASLFFVLLLTSVFTATAIGLDGGRKKPPPAAPIAPPPPPGLGVFDYYILAIQWPISFCKDIDLDPANECKRTSLPILPEKFTVHGLWPSKSVGEPVRSGELFDITQIGSLATTKMKDFWPSAKNFEKRPNVLTYKEFWGHQWQKHGAESGLSQKDYFSLAVQLYEKAKIISEPYFARRSGSNINVAAMQAAFSSLGVPVAVCNKDLNGRQQLVELRFKITKLGNFQNYTGTERLGKVCPPLAYLPAN